MSVRSLNKVQLIGNLTRDPELRYTPQGTAVCSFGVATNREWTDQEGQKQEEAEFHRIVAWHKLAELCSQLLFKGRKVYVEGRLQTRTWTGQDEQERQTTEVVIDNMIILDRRRKPGDSADQGYGPANAGDDSGQSLSAQPSDDGQQDDTKKEPNKKSPKGGSKTKTTKKETKKEKGKEEVKADDIPF